MSDNQVAGSESKIDIEAADRLEKKFDTALATRDNGPLLSRGLYLVAIAFAIYHVWTAGFGTPVEHEHMGIHLTGLFILIFAGFPLIRTQSALEFRPRGLLRWGNIPAYDWAFAILGVMAASLFGRSHERWTYSSPAPGKGVAPARKDM